MHKIGGREPAKRMIEQRYAAAKASGTYKGCDAYADFRELLEQGKDTQTICEELDQHHIEPLPAMRAAGIDSWVAAWTHERLNRNIQQLIAKLKGRRKPVKR